MEGPDQGMVMDFSDLSAVVKESVVEQLDHRLLNEIIENPTCERLLMWIADILAARLPSIEELVLWETDSSCAILREQVGSERVPRSEGYAATR